MHNRNQNQWNVDTRLPPKLLSENRFPSAETHSLLFNSDFREGNKSTRERKKYKQPIKVIKPKTKTKRVEKSQELTGAGDEERCSSAPFGKTVEELQRWPKGVEIM